MLKWKCVLNWSLTAVVFRRVRLCQSYGVVLRWIDRSIDVLSLGRTLRTFKWPVKDHKRHYYGRKKIYGKSKKTTLRWRDKTKKVAESKVDSRWGLLTSYSLSRWCLFLDRPTSLRRLNLASICSLLIFVPLHYLHLGISKLVKECMVNYSSYDRLVAGEVVRRRNSWLKIRLWGLRGCNLLLETIEGTESYRKSKLISRW